MTGPHPAVATCRWQVRRALTFADLPAESTVIIACSGGPDSLALAASVAFEAPRFNLRTVAVVVDHQLQEGSAAVAERAAAQCREFGVDAAEVRTVEVVESGEGPVAAARSARYAALEAAASSYGAGAVLLGHTRDDQAETVLLALARGSGPRAISGMAPLAGGLWLRPLLNVSRADTHAVCAALGLRPWHDPQNDDPRYLRVRVRQSLADLEARIGPGVVAGLARTADLVRDDLDFLDETAQGIVEMLGEQPWQISEFVDMATPLRSRVWRELLRRAGSPPSSLSKVHVDAVDALVTAWRGQRAIHIPGRLQVRRDGGLIHVEERRVE